MKELVISPEMRYVRIRRSAIMEYIFYFSAGRMQNPGKKERKSSNSCARIVPLHCCLRAIHRRTESFGRQVNFHLKKVDFLLEWFASQRQQNCITAIKEPAFALKMLINIFYETT